MTPTLFMLDTDIISYIVSGRHHQVRARLTEKDPVQICVSVVTVFELLYGLKRLPPDHRLQTDTRSFLTGLAVLAWENDAAEICAEMRHGLISGGQVIGELDMMIAAHAPSIGATLVSNNTRHFARIPGLTVENWTIPPG